jgi:pimeloyl-ACP methyl ester carboxylesterase
MQGGAESPAATRVWVSPRAGGGGSVCVSGLGGGTQEWIGVGPALARYGDVLAVELILGPASAPQCSGGPLQIAVEALDRVHASASGRPVLIGHSMGALAGMLIAATDSRRLAGLVLTAPFVPADRNGRSTVAAAVDYARHRVLFLTGTRQRRRQRSGPRAVSRRSSVAGLRALAHYGLRPRAFHAMADRVVPGPAGARC